ncbi:response regulator transcription factor [Ferviditalea candida]|uniref:Response regulator transcription factor n=1 Tax=Ferviditalea candida TaxID=3108399 RepID=A0ABU5ZI74_9BACL|nr:response regulator transcription factor [Paenibacillaceae bacterium T2]
MKKILVVDDDVHICKITKLYLEKHGYEVETVYDGLQAVGAYERGRHDLIVLDLMLPGLDGRSICHTIRETSDVPIIMLTAKGEVGDRIGGLQLGADDYMVKPFDPNELVARTESVLRRMLPRSVPERNGGVRKYGTLRIDETAYQVYLRGEPVNLPRREFELLLFLAKHPNQVFSREDLITKVWGWDFDGEDRVVDLYVKRLRHKLADASGSGSAWRIRTIWGVGYKFEVSAT